MNNKKQKINKKFLKGLIFENFENSQALLKIFSKLLSIDIIMHCLEDFQKYIFLNHIDLRCTQKFNLLKIFALYSICILCR